MCICFFDDGPIDKDPRANRANMFKVGMKDAPCKDPAICCAGFLCNPCMGCYMRKKVLGGNLDLYMCCQGYYDGLCCGHPKAGSYGDTGNPACMACEMICCPGWATSATRQYVMDQYDLASDPCDRQIIRFNNFMQLLSCICYTLALFEPSCRAVWKSTSVSGAPDNSSLTHISAMTRPSWLGRAARNRHRHAIEQASRRWRGRRDERAVKF